MNILDKRCSLLIKVISGMFQSSSKVIVTQVHAIQMFIHESMRIFYDRLVDNSDRQTFCEILSDAIYEHFKVSYSMIMLYTF